MNPIKAPNDLPPVSTCDCVSECDACTSPPTDPAKVATSGSLAGPAKAVGTSRFTPLTIESRSECAVRDEKEAPSARIFLAVYCSEGDFGSINSVTNTPWVQVALPGVFTKPPPRGSLVAVAVLNVSVLRPLRYVTTAAVSVLPPP